MFRLRIAVPAYQSPALGQSGELGTVHFLSWGEDEAIALTFEN
jgi:hypothetical protein